MCVDFMVIRERQSEWALVIEQSVNWQSLENLQPVSTVFQVYECLTSLIWDKMIECRLGIEFEKKLQRKQKYQSWKEVHERRFAVSDNLNPSEY